MRRRPLPKGEGEAETPEVAAGEEPESGDAPTDSSAEASA
jgi:hypothetical protein